MSSNLSKNLQSFKDRYNETYSIPEHPSQCPSCSNKVQIYQLNRNGGLFMCSNITCSWPLETHTFEEIYGTSDSSLLVQIEKFEEKASQDENTDQFFERNCVQDLNGNSSLLKKADIKANDIKKEEDPGEVLAHDLSMSSTSSSSLSGEDSSFNSSVSSPIRYVDMTSEDSA